jgi:hypothetical protein
LIIVLRTTVGKHRGANGAAEEGSNIVGIMDHSHTKKRWWIEISQITIKIASTISYYQPMTASSYA